MCICLSIGTILHPQKIKKERLPLAELLSNLPKYPVAPGVTESVGVGTGSGQGTGNGQGNKNVPYRSNDAWSRSTRDHTRRSRPVTTYDMLANYAVAPSSGPSPVTSSGTYR